jgi:hypothetical protein
MEVVIQLSLLTISVCVGAVALAVRTNKRADSDARISVNPVSSHWLADLKTRTRLE